jgi:hypothetical protein
VSEKQSSIEEQKNALLELKKRIFSEILGHSCAVEAQLTMELSEGIFPPPKHAQETASALVGGVTMEHAAFHQGRRLLVVPEDQREAVASSWLEYFKKAIWSHLALSSIARADAEMDSKANTAASTKVN